MTDQRITSLGTIRYGMKALGGHSGRWYAVIDCDPEIGRYMRYLYNTAFHKCRSLQRPAWKEHVTFIRDEEPEDLYKSKWGFKDGTIVTFEIDVSIQDNGVYYWLPVYCDEVLNLREELGLNRNPLYPLHLSIGHNKDANFAA